MTLIVMCAKCGTQVETLWVSEAPELGWHLQKFTAYCHGEEDNCVVDMTQLVAQVVVRAETFIPKARPYQFNLAQRDNGR